MLNLVKITNNQVTTTSKQIADVFEKEHKNILAAISSMDIPEDFRGLNFKPFEFRQIIFRVCCEDKRIVEEKQLTRWNRKLYLVTQAQLLSLGLDRLIKYYLHNKKNFN